MNQLEYISTITTNLHGNIESWARNLLREAGIDTTEVYGQFPPEGTVASHIVLFPYRLGSLENQISQPIQDISLLRTDISKIPVGTVPPLWSQIGRAITICIHEKFPKMTKGQQRKGKTRKFFFQVYSKDKNIFQKEASQLNEKLVLN